MIIKTKSIKDGDIMIEKECDVIDNDNKISYPITTQVIKEVPGVVIFRSIISEDNLIIDDITDVTLENIMYEFLQ